jgi:type I restriction enzyme, S subunit
MRPTNAVVLSRDATVGRAGILGKPMATSQHFVNWICGEDLLSEYLLRVFRGPMQQEFMSLTMGSTLRTIGLPDVYSFRTPIPSISEQQIIISYLKDETNRIDTLIAKVSDVIEQLREYRTALIAVAVTGKMDVRNA